MSLDKLGKQFRRDVAANPKKAAALGVMVLVALYFWGPLALKWLSASGGKRSNKANMASLILTDDPIEPSQQRKGRGGSKFRWEKARQLIRQDPRMSSATFDPTWTDPFGQPALTAAQTPADEAARAEALAGTTASSLEPGELGIALGSIMIGSRTRAATINGEACHEGDVVAVTDKHDKAVIHHLRVMRIVREGVELDLGGRKIMVELAQPKLAQGDDFERGKPKERN